MAYQPDVRELPLAASDEDEGIDHRWELRWLDPTDPLGHDLRCVVHVRGGKGAWAGGPIYLCSRCRSGDPRQPDDGSAGFCEDVEAVRAWQRAHGASA